MHERDAWVKAILFICVSPQPDRIANTWMGDPVKMVVLETVIKEIQSENLLSLVKESGEVLLSGLKELEVQS